MKKYIVTSKNKVLKEGLTINENCFLDNANINFGKDLLNDWLYNGWIEKIQYPEFTKNDLVEFLEYLLKQNDRHCEIEAIDFINEWINEK